MANYTLQYTGEQIDEAVGLALDNISENTIKLNNIEDGATKNIIVSYTANLSMDGWTDNTDYASQTVTVSGILASDNPIVDINVTSLSASGRQAVASAWCEVYYISTENDSITVESSSIPTTDIPIQIMVVR